MVSELPVALRPDLLFPMVVHRTQQIWRESLSRVSVDTATSLDAAVKLYTAVYHTLMAPSIFSEGQIYPPSADVPSTPSPVYLSFDGSPNPWPNPPPYLPDMSMYCTCCPPPANHDCNALFIWDTHRSLNPWLVLFKPDMAHAVVLSLLTMARDGGDLPKWPLADV